MNLTPDSKVLVQGITQPVGSYHAARMKAYGTNIVAGVSAGEGGQELQGIPVFDLVEQARQQVGSVDATIIFVESYWALDAELESIDAGIPQIILVTNGIPPLDMVRLLRKAQTTETLIVGPSRAGTLTYEVAVALTHAGVGQSIGVSLGTDGIIGSCFRQWLQVLARDESTEAIVLVDQAGGGSEEETAQYIAEAIDKPVIAYVAGCYTPEDKQVGNAGAIIAAQLSGPVTNATTAPHKVAAFKEAKAPVAERPSQIPELVKKALKK